MAKMNIDIPLSEKVAKEAGNKINNLNKELDNSKDSHLHLLQDILYDMRDQRKFLKNIIVSLFIIISLLIGGLIGLSVYNQNALKAMSEKNTKMFADFLGETEFYTETTFLTDNYSENNGNLSIYK